MKLITLSTIATALLVALGTSAARAADTVVQFPLTGVLDGRSVFTLTNGVIVPFTLAIDGGNGDVGTGAQNGFATKAVAMMKSPANVANSLPDDGHFPADANHPEVVLSFSNAADAASPQNHLVKPPITPTTPGSSFSFPVNPATYSKLFLFFHGANGGTMVKITLTYADATTDVTNAMIPDFFNAPSDAKVFVLAPDLAKWTKTTTIAEANHHNIFGVTVAPMAKTLSMVKVERGATGFLVFWGATGVATTAVGGLPDAGADASAPTGDAGGAGAGGVTGAGGASGGGGATGGAGGQTTGAGGAGGQTSGAGGQTSGAGGTGVGGSTSAGTGGGAGATSTTGTAGASGTHGSSGGGGCSCRLGANDADASGLLWLALGAATVWCLGRRRRA